VRAVREAVGPKLEILVDANQGWQMPWDTSAPWDFKTAAWMADALAELDVFWLEEPLPRHDYRGLAQLRQRARVRIAGGEGNREFAETMGGRHDRARVLGTVRSDHGRPHRRDGARRGRAAAAATKSWVAGGYTLTGSCCGRIDAALSFPTY
jgi:hypothetical protein